MSYQYKVAGRTVTLEVDPGAVAVRFDDSLPRPQRANVAESSGTGPFGRRFEVPNEKLTIVPVVAAGVGMNGGSGPQILSSLNAKPEVSQALPVFRVNGNQVVASDRLLVGLDDPSAVADLAQRHRLRPVKSHDDVVTYEVEPGVDIFKAVEALDAEPAVRFAEPDLVTIGRHVPKRVAAGPQPLLGDPLVAKQYAMRLTGAADAWEIAGGSAEISIAILDEGVDTRHSDLAAAIVGTFDAADGDSYQDPNPWDGHGTACAGLAAAIPGNDVGIRGVAGGCSILAVRIARSDYDGGPWVTTNGGIASAIHWSWKSGAAVLSNSWGGGAPSNAIAEEFEKARTLGRGGRGCVIVIAAGNDYSEVSFPGTLPNVLTVSASNQYDEAKTPTSKDGETWWGTNHGPEIDVAAPGVQNLTTDNSAAAGYDPGDYEQRFNGTSSSTPIVAGACALVLSVNPELTEAEVREIIGATADRVGGQPYPGGRNDFFGRGRLNVLAAVRAATG